MSCPRTPLRANHYSCFPWRDRLAGYDIPPRDPMKRSPNARACGGSRQRRCFLREVLLTFPCASYQCTSARLAVPSGRRTRAIPLRLRHLPGPYDAARYFAPPRQLRAVSAQGGPSRLLASDVFCPFGAASFGAAWCEEGLVYARWAWFRMIRFAYNRGRRLWSGSR